MLPITIENMFTETWSVMFWKIQMKNTFSICVISLISTVDKQCFKEQFDKKKLTDIKKVMLSDFRKRRNLWLLLLFLEVLCLCKECSWTIPCYVLELLGCRSCFNLKGVGKPYWKKVTHTNLQITIVVWLLYIFSIL